MKNLISIIFLSVVLAGCASLPGTTPPNPLSDNCSTQIAFSWYPEFQKQCREYIIGKNSDWPQDIKGYILNGQIVIGMTREQVLASWGPPSDTNRTVTAFSQHEQWVYNHKYVYFDDGKLTSWQD